ncbi:type II secretion system F family protein [Methyloglobulus sp.]|uniref:type II secretion system F family protein n=1 Tax=Methyloglobulus sp. TaxID=2518622 RepID=UPI00398A346C
MDFLMQLLTGLVEKQQGSEWLVILMVSGAVFILALALMSLFDDFFDPVRSRFMREINAGPVSMIESDNPSSKLLKHSRAFVPSNKLLLQRTTTRLHYGGFHRKKSLLHFYAIRMLLMILLPFLVLIVMGLIPSIKGEHLFQGVLIALALGYLIPSFVLDKLIIKRQKIIQRSFPDALDMIVICSEAGLSLDAALQKVTTETMISHPELANELGIVIAETRAGVDRNKAMKRLVERTGVEDIRGLVSALAQSMRFGTNIAETLRIFSEDLRDKRTQAAEEAAAKIGLKLIFPLGICLLPAFLIVVLGPTMIIFSKI